MYYYSNFIVYQFYIKMIAKVKKIQTLLDLTCNNEDGYSEFNDISKQSSRHINTI